MSISSNGAKSSFNYFLKGMEKFLLRWLMSADDMIYIFLLYISGNLLIDALAKNFNLLSIKYFHNSANICKSVTDHNIYVLTNRALLILL